MSDAEAIALLERMLKYSHTQIEIKANGPDVLITGWSTTGYGATLKEAMESWKSTQSAKTLRRLLS